MMRHISPSLRSLCLASIFLTPLAVAEIGPYPSKLSPDGKLGIMGDSLALGIHASEMCGNADAYECAQQDLGASSPDWSYVAADKSWSIASLLGFDTAHRVAAYGGGEEWKDALGQARTIMADPQVEAVFIGLGANNVCTPQGHDYTDDLATIAGEIDATLTFLTDTLPPGGRIYWSGVLDVSQLRELMRKRDHNYWFETCQGAWDLDANKIKDGAANDVCDHFFNHTACQLTSTIEEAKDELMKLLFNTWLNLEGVDEGPCGKILSSRSTDADRAEARQFNLALNQLMSAKAVEYDGRNGIAVYYSDRIFEASANLRPYHVSHLDCFHPSRAGQMFLANETWRGFDPLSVPASRYFFDEFDSQDYCAQEYTMWDSCWTEIGENNGPSTGDIQINVHELRVRDNDKGIMRSLDLDGMQAAWLQFNWRREGLDNNDDYVSIDVSPDAGVTWYQQDRIKGDGDDYNMHRGYYCDITPYATGNTVLRFKSSSDLGVRDKVFFDNITVIGWGPAVLADLAIVSASSPNPVQAGEQLTYTLTVTNNGPSEALDTVVVDSITYLSGALNALPSQGSCSGTEPVTCNLGTLANGATATIMLTATVEPTFVGPVTNIAKVQSSGADPDTSNNQTVLATTVVPLPGPEADLGVSVSTVSGGTTVYNYTVTNAGPAIATNVTLTGYSSEMTLSAFQSAMASQGHCWTDLNVCVGLQCTSVLSEPLVVTCELGAMSPATTVTGTFKVDVLEGTLNTAFSVKSEVSDPNSTNNSVTATTTVSPVSSSSSGGGGGGGCTVESDAQFDPLWLLVMISSVAGVVFQRVIRH